MITSSHASPRHRHPQERYKSIPGVVNTVVGYTGGTTANPTYNTVCRNDGHTEAIKVEFDPGVISYEELMRTFFSEAGGGGGKTQYQSAVWPQTDEQKAVAQRLADERHSTVRPLPTLTPTPIPVPTPNPDPSPNPNPNPNPNAFPFLPRSGQTSKTPVISTGFRPMDGFGQRPAPAAASASHRERSRSAASRRAVLRVDQLEQFLRALGKRRSVCLLSEVACRMELSCAPKARIHVLQAPALML